MPTLKRKRSVADEPLYATIAGTVGELIGNGGVVGCTLSDFVRLRSGGIDNAIGSS